MKLTNEQYRDLELYLSKYGNVFQKKTIDYINRTKLAFGRDIEINNFIDVQIGLGKFEGY